MARISDGLSEVTGDFASLPRGERAPEVNVDVAADEPAGSVAESYVDTTRVLTAGGVPSIGVVGWSDFADTVPSVGVRAIIMVVRTDSQFTRHPEKSLVVLKIPGIWGGTRRVT